MVCCQRKPKRRCAGKCEQAEPVLSAERPSLSELLTEFPLGPLKAVWLDVTGQHGPRYVQRHDDIDAANFLLFEIHTPAWTQNSRRQEQQRTDQQTTAKDLTHRAKPKAE